MNEVEKFHFNIMKDFVVSGKIGKLEKWFLELDFDYDREKKLFDILDEFYNKSEFTYCDFERKMENEFGCSYQHVKCLISSLYEDRRWTEVVQKFLEDMKKTVGNNFSVEYKWIAKELGLLDENP
ncbi:hypothetical protein [Neisseria sp. CCUG12390]|uniref:hypothetical protein n=1 Tax=Neisseria sp. CCUG12390 TaxID=3392035 RepID=UPI003A100095